MFTRFEIGILATIRKKLKSNGADIEELQTTINQILPGYTYKGSVATKSALPSGATTGDMYTVVDEDYVQYAWDGENWISPLFPKITEQEIDAIF